MARPTKLDKHIQDKIVNAIRAGNYIETAAAYAGIHKSTLYDWLKRGEREKQRVAKNSKGKIIKKEQPYVEFSDAIEKALAEAEVRDVAIIAKAAEEQWQAAAWRLERKFPDRWGKRNVEIEHKGQVEVKNNDVHRIELQLARDPGSRELLRELYRRSKSMEDICED